LRIAKVEKRRQASLVFSLMEKPRLREMAFVDAATARKCACHRRLVICVIGAAVRIASNTIPFASNIGAERFPS
jgi:hypothetical protein